MSGRGSGGPGRREGRDVLDASGRGRRRLLEIVLVCSIAVVAVASMSLVAIRSSEGGDDGAFQEAVFSLLDDIVGSALWDPKSAEGDALEENGGQTQEEGSSGSGSEAQESAGTSPDPPVLPDGWSSSSYEGGGSFDAWEFWVTGDVGDVSSDLLLAMEAVGVGLADSGFLGLGDGVWGCAGRLPDDSGALVCIVSDVSDEEDGGTSAVAGECHVRMVRYGIEDLAGSYG